MPNWYIKFITSGLTFHYPVSDLPIVPITGDKIVLLGQTREVTEVITNIDKEEILVHLKE